MNFQETIGIDVSKPFIDVYIHTTRKHRRFKNTKTEFKEMIQWINRNTETNQTNRLFAFEHTGLYSIPLSVFLTENKLSYIIIPGLELKKSLGIARGKDDKIDAKAIALYAYRRREEVKPYKLPSKHLLELRRLLSLREKLIRQRTGFKSTNTEIKDFLTSKEHITYFKVHEEMIKALSVQIKVVDKKLLEIVRNDKELKKLYELITSVKSVGTQTALFLIAFTNGFTLFENSRKFASYAGIAPFPYKSGISIQGKTKVNELANKKFKSLLSNCAVNAIMKNQEMKIYYEKRLKEGKDKMSTINIIRNKLLARVFAAVQRGTPYVDTLSYAS